MKTVTITGDTSAKRALSQGEKEEVVVVRDGRPVALVVPFGKDDLEWYARERDPKFIESIARARRQVKAGQTVSHKQLKDELGM